MAITEDKLYKGKSINRSFVIRSPGELTKVKKQILKTVANENAKQMRSKIIDSAYLIRDTVADNAPRPLYKRILMGEKLEKHENKNSGFDVKMEGSLNMSFQLQLSTSRFSKGTYKGWNPIIGLLNSNYGRKAITVSGASGNLIPIPTEDTDSGKAYNHPRYGQGYGNRYKNSDVIFTDRVRAVQGTHWIEQGVNKASIKVNNIIAGRTTYGKRKTTNKYWG